MINSMIIKVLAFWHILIFSICQVSGSFAQETKEIDSLKSLLKIVSYDSARIKIQLKLFNLYSTSDTGQANIILANLTKEIDDKNIPMSPDLLYMIGQVYENDKADFNTAIEFFQRATDKAKQENDLKYLDYELWLGYTLSRTGDTEQGLSHVINAVEAVENMKLINKMPFSYIILAFSFRNANQYGKAKLYLNKALLI